MSRIGMMAGVLLPCFGMASFLHAETLQNPPGTYTTSWVGNSFGGGDGRWVQSAARKITVSPDGTLIAGVPYDEGGRCVGLYKAGTVNTALLKERIPSHVWGWGTGSAGVAVSGNYLYDATLGGAHGGTHELLAFSWTPGDINTAVNVGAPVSLANPPVGLSASDNILAVVYPHTIEVRRTYEVDPAMSVLRSFPVGDSTHVASDVAIASDKSFWVLTGTTLTHFDPDGKNLGVTVPGLQDPVSVAFDNQGRLMVCDNGTYQIKFFTVTGGPPALAATFGAAGGLLSGTPGVLAPGKLYNLVGAGTDASGNIYAGMSFHNEPGDPFASAGGNLYLSSYTPTGTLKWSLFAGSYINNFGFDPASDGQKIYSGTGVYDLNLTNSASGTEQSLIGITLDTKNYPGDPRGVHPASIRVRYPTPGHRTLYGIGQFARGYAIYGFATAQSEIASPLTSVGNGGWAWDVDANAGIWNGDARGKQIDYFPFQGWNGDTPVYPVSAPTVYAWPTGWDSIQRVEYVPATDTLYIAGYLARKPAPKGAWGLIGNAVARYDGWVHGGKKLIWTNPSLPLDSASLPPKSLDVAGDYLFMPGVNAAYKGGPHAVHILNATTGAYLGAFQPGPALGSVGNVDTPYAVNALERANGEYLITVEEDWRAKQILYRWMPPGAPKGAP